MLKTRADCAKGHSVFTVMLLFCDVSASAQPLPWRIKTWDCACLSTVFAVFVISYDYAQINTMSPLVWVLSVGRSG